MAANLQHLQESLVVRCMALPKPLVEWAAGISFEISLPPPPLWVRGVLRWCKMKWWDIRAEQWTVDVC